MLGLELTILLQDLMYDILKRISGNGPVYPVLGNHDTYNQYVSHLLFLVQSFMHPLESSRRDPFFAW